MNRAPPFTLDEIVEGFRLLDDWQNRYEYLIELGERLPPVDARAKIETNRVQGCMSKVWIVARPDPGQPRRLVLDADSDTGTVKGLAAILVALFSARTPQEILAADADGIFTELGLFEHLSPTRHVGVYAMVEFARNLARRRLEISGAGATTTYAEASNSLAART
jgi:cysteine desulfuration protein SufE